MKKMIIIAALVFSLMILTIGCSEGNIADADMIIESHEVDYQNDLSEEAITSSNSIIEQVETVTDGLQDNNSTEDILIWGWQGDVAFYSNQDNLLGLINKNGDVLIEAQYEQVRSFQDGIAAVMLNNKWGFIRTDGSVVSEPIWDSNSVGITSSSGFKNGFAKVCQSGLYGFIDQNGNVICEPQWNNAGSFSDGYAWVSDGTHCGYINESGDIVIPLLYTDAGDFNNGYAIVSTHLTLYNYFAIDKCGNPIGEKKWERIQYDAGANLFEVVKDSAHYLMDTQGNILKTNTPVWNWIGEFIDGVATASSDICQYYIDLSGNALNIECFEYQWDTVLDYSEGYGIALKDGLCYCLNTKGEILFQIPCDYAEPFHEGLALIRQNSKNGYIDSNGNIVIEPEWSSAECFSEGLAYVKRKSIDGKINGFINTSGELVISGEWSDAGDFHEGLACVYLPVGEKTVEEEYFSTESGEYETRTKTLTIEKWGYINTQGEVVITPQWSYAGIFENGVAIVKDGDDRIMYIDTNGIPLYPLENDFYANRERFNNVSKIVKDME